ncbi:MAG: hypothetical protein A3G83_00455 [Betaproteobacteria bacterium RIFCSPLOWO2_12_FULL_68_20]|nr:MAG: hypothetical protein A3G83_00455 [Betaproteobacteria bacterium RIFCSPLOWO2_12_FULL_68_20]
MRIGVYSGDFPPTEGGGHTFVSTVLDAFFDAAPSSDHEFVAFCEPGQREALAQRCTEARVELAMLPSHTALGMGIATLRHYAPFAYLLRRWPGRLERTGRERGVQAVWFVPGLAHDALDIPYVGTVWDLQHRLHPWFPEVCSDGYWEHRELVYSRFVRRATHLVTGTRVGAEQLSRLYGVAPERISVLPQPAPRVLAQAEPSQAVAALGAERFFLYPAQFWPHKNHVNLLHALKLLEERHGERLSLVLPGADKGNAAHVRRTSEALGLAARVHLPGFVSAADLAWLYRRAAALVYPSFNGPDNLPPLEAFAHGCPVVLAEYPGAREQAGDAALFFDPRDPGELAAKLASLLRDAPLAQELARRGRERAARWTAHDYVRGIFGVLDALEPIRRCWP